MDIKMKKISELFGTVFGITDIQISNTVVGYVFFSFMNNEAYSFSITSLIDIDSDNFIHDLVSKLLEQCDKTDIHRESDYIKLIGWLCQIAHYECTEIKFDGDGIDARCNKEDLEDIFKKYPLIGA